MLKNLILNANDIVARKLELEDAYYKSIGKQEGETEFEHRQRVIAGALEFERNLTALNNKDLDATRQQIKTALLNAGDFRQIGNSNAYIIGKNQKQFIFKFCQYSEDLDFVAFEISGIAPYGDKFIKLVDIYDFDSIVFYYGLFKQAFEWETSKDDTQSN